MKIRLNTNYADATARGYPGDIIDLPDAVAQSVIAGGYAVAVETPSPAVAEAPAPAVAAATPPAPAVAEITTLEDRNVKQVLELVASGALPAARALELEQTGKKRPSLLAQLTQLANQPA